MSLTFLDFINRWQQTPQSTWLRHSFHTEANRLLHRLMGLGVASIQGRARCRVLPPPVSNIIAITGGLPCPFPSFPRGRAHSGKPPVIENYVKYRRRQHPPPNPALHSSHTQSHYFYTVHLFSSPGPLMISPYMGLTFPA